MSNKCPNCGFLGIKEHWNPATLLPPVRSPIYIIVEGEELLVVRDQWAASKHDSLTFDRCDNGNTITGKFMWRHA